MQHPPFERTSNKTLQQIDIFISSPGDVKQERQVALRVIRRLNRIHYISDRYLLKALAYEDIVPPTVGQQPQTTVDHYMMEAGKSDLFICILCHRMGTSVIHEETSEQFQSGTEYEFTDAYRANQKSGKPYILLYRGMKSLPADADPEQLQRVEAFFKRFEGEHAEFKGLYKRYRSNKQFEEMLFHDLETVISQDLIRPHDSGIASTSLLVPTHRNRQVDWGEAPHTRQFYGREKELTELEQWIVDDRCQLVAVLGIGGIGKTTLAAKLAEQIKDEFEYVFWRSLQNAPPLETILKNCIQFLSNQQRIDLPNDINGQITLLIQHLQENRCLLVLDNLETILQSGNRAGEYREGYEGYGRLIQRIGEGKHQSCLLLTSREKAKEVAHLEGKTSPVRSLQLPGLGQLEGQEILKDKGLFGSDEAWADLIHTYTGNPLALKLAAEPIR